MVPGLQAPDMDMGLVEEQDTVVGVDMEVGVQEVVVEVDTAGEVECEGVEED